MHADGRIDWRHVEGLLQDSYRQVALKRMLAALELPWRRQAGTSARQANELRPGASLDEARQPTGSRGKVRVDERHSRRNDT
jgi:hypothetical protein